MKLTKKIAQINEALNNQLYCLVLNGDEHLVIAEYSKEHQECVYRGSKDLVEVFLSGLLEGAEHLHSVKNMDTEKDPSLHKKGEELIAFCKAMHPQELEALFEKDLGLIAYFNLN